MTFIALIPARGGSKRIPGKNTRVLEGHPLIAYTIRAALDSGCFEKVLVSSDDIETLSIAADYGADCIKRPDIYATDTSPDIEWVTHALGASGEWKQFSILRPTSPFRGHQTIRRAVEEWNNSNFASAYSSLRAVERVSQHPGKMWQVRGNELVPLVLQPSHPFHDSQMAALPAVYVQNAALEIAWVDRTITTTRTISGNRVLPFMTTETEGFDLNTEYDWEIAVRKIRDGEWELPNV